MGFYIRKSISLGPFRFNLSKSGIGVSAGIKGLRFGTGPKGNYVHMGRGGIYFRQTLTPSGKQNLPRIPDNQNRTSPPQNSLSIPHDPTVGEFKEIDSTSVFQMTSSSSEKLLKEINEKHQKPRAVPIVAIFVGCLVMLLWYAKIPSWALALSVFIAVVGILLAHWRDQINKNVVIFYEFDSELEKAYQSLLDAFANITKCQRIKHVEGAAEVLDKKYHAGANKLVSIKSITLQSGDLPFLKTNIPVPLIPAGRQKLAFLPDRLLVVESGGVGAVEYANLKFTISAENFIEEDGVPSDSVVVGHTWKYVNKKGGPDKRFKDNRELPIVRYEQIAFSSDTGLNEVIQCSRVGVGASLEASVRKIQKNIKI